MKVLQSPRHFYHKINTEQSLWITHEKPKEQPQDKIVSPILSAMLLQKFYSRTMMTMKVSNQGTFSKMNII